MKKINCLFTIILLSSCFYDKKEPIEFGSIGSQKQNTKDANLANLKNIVDTVTPNGISLKLVEQDTLLYIEAKKGKVMSKIGEAYSASLVLDNPNPKNFYFIEWSNKNILILHRGHGCPALWESKIILFTADTAILLNCGEVIDISKDEKYAVISGEIEMHPLFLVDLTKNEILDTLYFNGFEEKVDDINDVFTHNFASVYSGSFYGKFKFEKDRLFFNFAKKDTFLKLKGH